MKHIVVATIFAFLALAVASANAKVVVTPLPDGEEPSARWSVQVNEQDAPLYGARTADAPFKKYNYGGDYAFLSVDADEPLTFRVKPRDVAPEALTVRPASLGIVPSKNRVAFPSSTTDANTRSSSSSTSPKKTFPIPAIRTSSFSVRAFMNRKTGASR